MRKLLLLLVLIVLIPHQAKATFADVQSHFNNACGAVTSCSVTVTAIGAGHLVVVISHEGNNTQLSSVTIAGETVTVIPVNGSIGINCPFNGGGNATQFGCAYVLSTVGGATTVTCNYSGTTGASNTSCGFYEESYTASSIYLETNPSNGSNSSASTFSGINFAANFLKFIQGYNDIIFQFTNVSTGTIQSINTSFNLDNAAGQVADAHRLNTFDMTTPTWTNSGAATSFVAALSFGESFTQTPVILPTTTGLQLSYDFNGLDSSQRLLVTSPGQFRLGFQQAQNWGLSDWWDLVNDPNATTDLFQPACGVGTCTPPPGPSAAYQVGGGNLFMQTFYHMADTSLFERSAHYDFPNTPRSLNILEATPSRVVVEVKSLSTVSSQTIGNNVISTVRFFIYQNGQIYIHATLTATNAATIAVSPDFIYSDVQLEDPTQTGTDPPDSQGWIRASATQNPYTGVASGEPYLFEYWGPSTPSPYTNYTKASIMIVHSPNNANNNGQILHSWGQMGHGVVRWGWSTGAATVTLGAGGVETEDYLIQLGTQNSNVLPNLNSSTVAGPIANAYIALPTPPSPLSISSAVNESTTAQFTTNQASGGTWSCSGCVGTVNSLTGLYSAPVSITAQQSHGGFQMLPNNHIYNTRIDSLLVNASNTTWVNTARATNKINYLSSFPFNYTNPATALEQFFHAAYTTNDGVYQVPPFPTGLIEGGWLSARGNDGSDHHLVRIDTTTGTVQENYQYYCGNLATTAASVNGSNLATLTFAKSPATCGLRTGQSVCVGGFTGSDTYFNVCPTASTITVLPTSITFTLTHATGSATTNGTVTLNTAGGGTTCSVNGTCNTQSGVQWTQHDYTLPTPTTDAAGLMLTPLVLRLQELEQAVASGGTINHALRVTLASGFETNSFIWPATTNNQNNSGTVPQGARARLKSAYDCSVSGAGGITSTIGNILCKQLQQYGLIHADAANGGNWQVTIAQEPWPSNYLTSFNEVNAAGKTSNITNVTANGATATITASNDLVATSTQVTVSATGNSNCGTMLNGSHTVASATGTQFTFSTAVNCTGGADTGTILSPLTNYMEFVDESGLMVSSSSGVTTNNREQACYSVGNTCTDVALQGVAVGLTQNILYIMAGTPTQNLNSYVNVTGDPNTNVTWSMNPAVGTLSPNGFYTAPSSQTSAVSMTITATSSANANVAAQMTAWICPNKGCRFVQGTADYTDSSSNAWKGGFGLGLDNLPQFQGCCQIDGSFANITDKQLWNAHFASSLTIGDERADFLVPQGTYQIIYRFGAQSAIGATLRDIVSQGATLASGVDMTQVAGGQHLPYSFQTIQQVGPNNKLSFYIYGDAGVSNTSADISSISIIPGAVRPRSGGLP